MRCNNHLDRVCRPLRKSHGEAIRIGRAVPAETEANRSRLAPHLTMGGIENENIEMGRGWSPYTATVNPARNDDSSVHGDQLHGFDSQGGRILWGYTNLRRYTGSGTDA